MRIAQFTLPTYHLRVTYDLDVDFCDSSTQWNGIFLHSKSPSVMEAFNSNGIIYDNSPWRPGRDIDVEHQADDERKLKNLATRVMSNGVEVLVKDKGTEGKHEQRKFKLMHLASTKPTQSQGSAPTQNISLLTSVVATVVNSQHINAIFPFHQYMQHNYIIKTCMTTYTYLTTVVQNKRSAVSTFETIVSVVTTESLTNVYATDVFTELKPSKTKYMEFKTIQTSPHDMFLDNLPKINKKIDSEDEGNFDLIQPSEVSHAPCTTSCSCSHTKTENLKTKYTNNHQQTLKINMFKTSKFGDIKFDAKPTNKEALPGQTQYRPYEYESSSQSAPIDKVVKKYTEVLSDMSDEKDTNILQESDLLTNEQAPVLSNKVVNNKTSEKNKPEKPQVNKNKLVVAELIKLGSLGIKGLSQLAPVVIEKMTGGFMKRQDNTNKITTTTTTVTPVTKVVPYSANKRIDTDVDSKQGNFPIYIPVDEMETSESQAAFINATLHHNYVWSNELKHSKAQIYPPKIIHEIPLVNGGIPISPGEVITANSDVIVGKPAVGGPLTLVASGMKLQNPVNPPPIDNFVLSNEKYTVKVKPTRSDSPSLQSTNVDDSFDLRPPELPKLKPKYNISPRPSGPHNSQQRPTSQSASSHVPISSTLYGSNDNVKRQPLVKNTAPVLANHGRPAFLDYIPSLVKNTNNKKVIYNNEYKITNNDDKDLDIADNNPSSSEVVSSKITTDGYVISEGSDSLSKPFLVDIQPSKVANVLIPHGSSTALVFAGSSEPHKTGDYVDDPLPYPEPGYFGSFSIDAPHMTNVHNVSPNKNQFLVKPSAHITFDSSNSNMSPNNKETQVKYDQKIKWNDNKRSKEFNKLPLPTSNQETHIQIGPHITVYNPDNFKGNLDKFSRVKPNDKNKDVKEVIDKDYENYLAVPPPPKIQFYRENYYDTNKPYYQRPVTRTKPVHDTKVVLNIQHPAPSQLPPKVTSEVYFATQLSNNQQVSNYNIRLPQSTPIHVNPQGTSQNNQYPQNNMSHKIHNQIINTSQNSLHVPINSDITNKTLLTNNNNDNLYTVTLNSASTIENNSNQAHVLGSSISVPLSIASQNDQMDANIPIGTNFAIRVEDDPAKYETVALHGKRIPPNIHDTYDHTANEIPIHHISRNNSRDNYEMSHIINEKLNSDSQNKNDIFKKEKEILFMPHSINSHANFPMINEQDTEISNNNKNIFKNDKNLPSKVSSNYQTNSHGWYSSILNEGNLKNINIETSSTRTIIPLKYDSIHENTPEFGQKIALIGKPPTKMWDEKDEHKNNYHIGKPFSKPNESKQSTISSSTSHLYNSPHIPSIYYTKQPVYDIPIRDESTEKTTANLINTNTEKVKPVYENAEEIFDGEEILDNPTGHDGEVSSESMKVPIITSVTGKDNRTKNLVALSQNISPIKVNNDNKDRNLVDFNPDTQTEKPFGTFTRPTFQSNNIKPIYEHVKPRPFTMNPAIPLDHQLQQPHWQINQLLENSTNISYEDNMELNTGEEINNITLNKNKHIADFKKVINNQYNTTNPNKSLQNKSNIITSTIQLKDRKPITVDIIEKTTLPTFTIPVNHSANEIIDLSPPPPMYDNNLKSSVNSDLIMGMSPPPPQTPSSIISQKSPQTSKPSGVMRTPQIYLQLPPKTLPPRLPTQRPNRKPINRDEISTYRPTYDFNKIKRPIYNREQPSSHLMPPPIKLPTKIPFIEQGHNSQAVMSSHKPGAVIFPTPISSGWLTSSGVEFSSGIKFAPTSIYFTDITPSSSIPNESSTHHTPLDTSNSYEYESFEESIDNSSEDTIAQHKLTTPKSVSTTNTTPKNYISNQNESSIELSYEDETINKTSSQGFKIRTRKPYPSRNDDKKISTSKYKVSSKPFSVIKPTRTLSRPEILYPTRSVSIKKNLRPMLPKTQIHTPSIIESSESSIEEYFVKPTEILHETTLHPTLQEITSVIEKTVTSTLTINREVSDSNIKPTNYAGNEVKISDEYVPTKTEFKTTIVTLTKTLSEPPQTVSSIGFVNLTHTLTVTHTKTSLVSQAEGAVTQTLVLTNTQTSTIVDVITEIYTQVEPTTIIETVTKHIPVPQVEPTPVQEILVTSKTALDDISMSSEESDNFIIRDSDVTENIQKIELEEEKDNDTFFVVMNKSQNGGKSPPVSTELESGDYEGITRNEQVNNNGVSQVLFGEILLAGTPYLETTNIGHPTGIGYSKECQPDCKATRNERCQRIDGIMKCVCRPGFARMFPDRPCKPTYTYSVGLALGSQGNQRLLFHESLADNSSKEYNKLSAASYEGINRMIMQSDLRDVYHGVHITKFRPIEIKSQNGEMYEGVANDFYVQLSDNAHESRLKEVIEKYLRHNNYSLGGTHVHAADQLLDKLNVSDFDECTSRQFHDCSEHARCFNLRGTYTCSCLEGFADLSVNTLYPGRICSSEVVGCAGCNYHGTCFERESAMICECFKWYSGKTCQVNLKAVLITVTVSGAMVVIMAIVYACKRCCSRKGPATQTFVIGCMQGMPSLHQGNMPKQRADRRALIVERPEAADSCSIQNTSLPYIPAKQQRARSSTTSKKLSAMGPPPPHAPPPPPAPAVLIPRARLHHDSRDNLSRKKSLEACSEAKLISYLESGASNNNDEMRRKHSMESSYSIDKEKCNKQGALVSAGFKVSTTVRPEEVLRDERDDASSVNKHDLEAELSRFDNLRKSYSQDDMSEWTDAERRIGELTLSEARSIGGTLPASTGRAASSTRLTHQEANTMAERDLGSTFLLPHVHLYKPDLTSDVSEFDSL